MIDEARKRLYVVNTHTSTVEVYDTRFSLPQLTGIKIGTKLTPLSLALSRETPPRYLYVAWYDGSTLDIIDLNSANFSSVSKQRAGGSPWARRRRPVRWRLPPRFRCILEIL